MNIDIQYRLKNNPMYLNYLRENSIWYKYLNRNPEVFNDMIREMKNKYKLNPSDKFNKMIDNINVLQNFLNVLK